MVLFRWSGRAAIKVFLIRSMSSKRGSQRGEALLSQRIRLFLGQRDKFYREARPKNKKGEG